MEKVDDVATEKDRQKKRACTLLDHLLPYLTGKIASLEVDLYAKALKLKFKSSSGGIKIENLTDQHFMKPLLAKSAIVFGDMLISIAKKPSMSNEDSAVTMIRDVIIKKAVEISGHGIGCIILMMKVFYLEIHGEIRRSKLSTSSAAAYEESIDREVKRIITDEVFLFDLYEASIHDCNSLFMPASVKRLKSSGTYCSEDCSEHFSCVRMSARREKRQLITSLKKFRASNAILKQHIKLPLTDPANYERRIYPDHVKLMDGDLSASSKSVRVLVILLDATNIVEHFFYARFSKTYDKKTTYAYAVETLCKKVNKYIQNYTQRLVTYSEIKLSRCNLQLIEEEEPVFEDGEILWINHLKPVKPEHVILDSRKAAIYSWDVTSHRCEPKFEMFDWDLCWWCYQRKGIPCERCGTVNFCSDDCRDNCWFTHYASYCRDAPRRPRTEQQVFDYARQIIVKSTESALGWIITCEANHSKNTGRIPFESILEYYTTVANVQYDSLLSSQFFGLVGVEEGPLDPHRHYDPVCLLTRLMRFNIHFHQAVQVENLDLKADFKSDVNQAEMSRVCTSEFIDREAKLLAHVCVNTSNLQAIPEIDGKRLTSDMLHDIGYRGPMAFKRCVPFTNSSSSYDRILYDRSCSKCDLIDWLGPDPNNRHEKLLWLFLLDSEMHIRCQHPISIPRQKEPHNIRAIEQAVLLSIQKHDCGGLPFGRFYIDLRLSRHNLQLITGESAEFEDGEILLLNHVYYPSLLGLMWRVLIHDATVVLADPKLCNWCYTKVGRPCTSCRTAIYCSKECQSIHWPTHRYYCKGSDELIGKAANIDVLQLFNEMIRSKEPSPTVNDDE